MMDKFGQVPYRDSYDDMTLDAQVYTRAEAFAIAVSLATDALSGLPEKYLEAQIRQIKMQQNVTC